MRTRKMKILALAPIATMMFACNQESSVNPDEKGKSANQRPAIAAWTSAPTTDLPLIPVLYKDGSYTGEERIVLENIAHLDDIAFNDHTSSIIIHKGPTYSQWKANHGGREPVVKFYTNANYTGTEMRLRVGRYADLHASTYNFGDQITSIFYIADENATHQPSDTVNIKTFSDVPLVAELYNNSGYANHFHTIIYSTDNLSLKLGSAHNDEATSLYLKRGPTWSTNAQIEFCKDPNYSICTTLNANSGDNGYTNLGTIGYNDAITSLRIKNGSGTVVNYP